MRGALGDMLCTEGDINYDLSKVYQSLCGYDFMIMDKNLDHIALGVLRDLEEVKARTFAMPHIEGGVRFVPRFRLETSRVSGRRV